MGTIVLTDVDLVLDGEIMRGTIVVTDGLISDISSGRTHLPSAIDGEGDLVLPGLVEIHTDALEWHLRPRQQSVWPADAAVAGHDAALAACGITTVFDSLYVGDLGGDQFRSDILLAAVEAITRSQLAGNTRIDHKLHLRCEVADPLTPGLFEQLIDNPLLQLVSLMDHTPGGRQYRDLDRYRSTGFGGHATAIAEAQSDIEARIDRLQVRQAKYAVSNWAHVATLAGDRGLPLASHDDATVEDIDLAVRSGVSIAEFPTTEVAARAAHEAGMRTAAGAPNIVRGGSHSGNVDASLLAASGLLDIVTSDYVPYSLLHAPFVLASNGVMRLSDAIALVTSHPADAVGLRDRGRIAIGLRADLIRVRLAEAVPVIRSVFSTGQRVG